MTNAETQEEERDVLTSIYESDESFKQLTPASFSYKIGEQGHPQSFVLEMRWGEGYPDKPPSISLDSVYNQHLSQECKEEIINSLEKEAEVLLGSPMTYSLIQHLQDNAEELVTLAHMQDPTSDETVEACGGETDLTTGRKRKEKKEVLSKRAKRKMAERTNAQGERPRGWNWVDLVKLSKTGSQLA